MEVLLSIILVKLEGRIDWKVYRLEEFSVFMDWGRRGKEI